MFSKGDILICVNNVFNQTGVLINLTIMKSYVIVDIRKFDTGTYVIVMNDSGNYVNTNINRFISLVEYRRMKITKIREKYETIL